MANLSSIGRITTAVFCRNTGRFAVLQTRCLSSTQAQPDQIDDDKKKLSADDKKSWLGRLISGDSSKTSHSKLLSDKDVVYEMQLHKVKPEFMEDYLKQYTRYVNLVKDKKTGAELVGSFTTEIGEQDEAVHLWRYPGGFPNLYKATTLYRTDKEFIDFRIARNKMLRKRKNEILLSFSFWGDIEAREGPNIYELRSYTLRPGTMIEWANNWARGIIHRQAQKEPVAGFFTNIGDINVVHHFWAYEDLQSRKEVREAAWRRPGWDDCVAHTVPLIRHVNTQILIPTPFSPLQ